MEGEPAVGQIQGQVDRSGPMLQGDQLLDMQALALPVGQLVHADAGGPHHADASQPCTGFGLHDAPDRFAQLLEQLRRGVVDVDCGHDDRAARHLLANPGLHLGLGTQGKKPALQGPDAAADLHTLGALGQLHAFRMTQVECQLCRTLVAALGLDFEAMQDDLLQPGWNFGVDRAWRHRVDIEPAAQAAHRARLAEGPLAGGQVVEHHAERKQVAARVIADELHLLGRHIGPGAHRQ